MKTEKGRLFKSNGSVTFEVCGSEECPRVTLTNGSRNLRMRDDYSNGFKIMKKLTLKLL